MYDPISILAGAAIISTGASIYNVMNPPHIPDPPPPTNTKYIDPEGNVVTGKYNKDTNTMETTVTKPPKTEDDIKRDKLRSTTLDNLAMTPADRIKAYQDYADNFTSGASKTFSKEMQKSRNSQIASMGARGMAGSGMEQGVMKDLAEVESEGYKDIASQGEMVKEQLKKDDVATWLQTIGMLDAGANADTAQANQSAQIGLNTSANVFNGLMNNYNTKVNTDLAKWQNKNQVFGDTARGLAFLYGYQTGGVKATKTDTAGSLVPRSINSMSHSPTNGMVFDKQSPLF